MCFTGLFDCYFLVFRREDLTRILLNNFSLGGSWTTETHHYAWGHETIDLVSVSRMVMNFEACIGVVSEKLPISRFSVKRWHWCCELLRQVAGFTDFDAEFDSVAGNPHLLRTKSFWSASTVAGVISMRNERKPEEAAFDCEPEEAPGMRYGLSTGFPVTLWKNSC